MEDETQTQTSPAQDLGISLEDIGPARKCITIEIPAQRIAQKIESNYSRLQSDAAIPGFRKGRAPRRLLERKFGTSVMEDTRSQLLGECYSQAVEDHKLDVIGEPDIKDVDQIKLPESGPLQFKVEVEVSPRVELPPLEGLKVNKPKLDVSDQDIDQEIDRLRNRHGQPLEVKDAPVQEKDYVNAAVRIVAGKDAGEDASEIQHIPEAWITVHGKEQSYKGHVAGIVVQQLGKKLIGKKAQDRVTISMTGPSGHENEKMRDKPITIMIDIRTIQRLEPASVEEVARGVGLESSDQLRQRITEVLEERNSRQQNKAMHEQICDQLLEQVQLDLPEGLTTRQSARLTQLQAMELAYTGLDQQEIEHKIAEMRQESQEKARSQLKRFFILDQAAKSLQVDVTDAEVNGRIAMMAMQQGRRPERLRQQMQREGELEHLFLQIREQKTLDKILQTAKISDAEPQPPAAAKSKPKTKTTKKKKKKKEKE